MLIALFKYRTILSSDAPCSGVARFESWPRHWPSWSIYFVVCLIPFRQMLGCCIKTDNETIHIVMPSCHCMLCSVTYAVGHAIAQAVSHRPVAAEARSHVRVSPCGICGGQSGTGTGFEICFLLFIIPQWVSTVILVYHLGMNNRPETWSHGGSQHV
jgi:hypothetical protein